MLDSFDGLRTSEFVFVSVYGDASAGSAVTSDLFQPKQLARRGSQSEVGSNPYNGILDKFSYS